VFLSFGVTPAPEHSAHSTLTLHHSTIHITAFKHLYPFAFTFSHFYTSLPNFISMEIPLYGM